VRWKVFRSGGNSQCSVAFREQYSLRVSLEHRQRRWRRDEIRQTVPHLRRDHGKGTVADGGQPRWRNDESGCWRRAQAPPRTEVGDTPKSLAGDSTLLAVYFVSYMSIANLARRLYIVFCFFLCHLLMNKVAKWRNFVPYLCQLVFAAVL